LRLCEPTYNRLPPIKRVALARTLASAEEQLEEETFPDIGSMNDQELKELIDNLTAEEQEVSYRRRILHGQIDILRAELVNRLRENRPEGATLIKGDDVQRLSEILAGRSEPPTKPPT
jgi:RsiG-like